MRRTMAGNHDIDAQFRWSIAKRKLFSKRIFDLAAVQQLVSTFGLECGLNS